MKEKEKCALHGQGVLTAQQQLRTGISARVAAARIGLARIAERVAVAHIASARSGIARADRTEVRVIVAIERRAAARGDVAGVGGTGIGVGRAIEERAARCGVTRLQCTHISVGGAVEGAERTAGVETHRIERTDVAATSAVEIIDPHVATDSATTLLEVVFAF